MARIRALREAGKPKSLIPEFEPGKFPALPPNVGTISEKSKTSNSQQKRTTTHKDGLKQSSKMKDDSDRYVREKKGYQHFLDFGFVAGLFSFF